MSDKNFNHIVRIFNTDLKGEKQLMYALRKIKGVNLMLSNAVCKISKVDRFKKVGYLSTKDIEAIEDTLKNLKGTELPEWFFNRRKDPETGEDGHIMGHDMKFVIENDVKTLKKIKSYKGFRHQWGLPLRGQRTKANFRRNKGKGSLGVKKKDKK